jgi:hypothetical protein
MVTIRITSFQHSKNSAFFPQNIFAVSYGSLNKQRLFPSTGLTGWSL